MSVANSAGAATQTVIIDVAGIGAGTLAPVAENSVNPAGESVAAIFTDNNVQNTTSILSGIAISQNSNSGGIWEYSTDGGTAWNNIPTNLTASSALVLAASDLIRLVPNINFVGAVTPLSVYGLDGSYSGGFTSGVTQTLVNVSLLPASDLVAPSAVDVNTSVSLVSQTIDWINTKGGTWTDAANANINWSTGTLPTRARSGRYQPLGFEPVHCYNSEWFVRNCSVAGRQQQQYHRPRRGYPRDQRRDLGHCRHFRSCQR